MKKLLDKKLIPKDPLNYGGTHTLLNSDTDAVINMRLQVNREPQKEGVFARHFGGR